MIKPYTAVGLIPTVRGIRKRADIKINLEHLKHLVKAASWLSSLDLPVRLIAFPEGALQAFNDEVLDLDHVTFARECAIDIPGEETEDRRKRTTQKYQIVFSMSALLLTHKVKSSSSTTRFHHSSPLSTPSVRMIFGIGG